MVLYLFILILPLAFVCLTLNGIIDKMEKLGINENDIKDLI